MRTSETWPYPTHRLVEKIAYAKPAAIEDTRAIRLETVPRFNLADTV